MYCVFVATKGVGKLATRRELVETRFGDTNHGDTIVKENFEVYTFGGHKNDVRRLHKVGNRLPGGYVASESLSPADNWIAKTHRQPPKKPTFGAIWYINAFSAPLFSSCFARRKPDRLAVGLPPYVTQPPPCLMPQAFQ
jgi:hypothetical protein